MYNDEISIFGKYLEIINEAKGVGTRIFGRGTGLSIKDVGTTGMSPEEDERLKSIKRDVKTSEALSENQYIDFDQIHNDAPPEIQKALKQFKKETVYHDRRSGEMSGRFVETTPDNTKDYITYDIDLPIIIAHANDYVVGRKPISRLATKGAKYYMLKHIEHMKNVPMWIEKLKDKFKNDDVDSIDINRIIDYSSSQEAWEYTNRMKRVRGGTGFRRQGVGLKPRALGGFGSEAPLMPKGTSSRELKDLEQRLPDVTTAILQTPDTEKLNAYEPQSKGIQDILKKPKEEPKKKPAKKKKVTKESYEPFIKVIPF